MEPSDENNMQFFKDMGICDGAYGVLERFFHSAGVTEYDYSQGYQIMLGMMDHLEREAAQSDDPAHATVKGWLKWCFDLRTRPEAITYFGDHIEEDLFRTADGELHASLEAAQDHRRRLFDNLRQDHSAHCVINGVKIGANASETWEVIDPAHANLAAYDAFVCHDSLTGLNHRASTPEEVMAFHAGHDEVLETVNQAEAAAKIERRITDASGEFALWVGVGEAG
jgi:hypothetical protein